jgi:MFS transporter, CP family, cyanate transporter
LRTVVLGVPPTLPVLHHALGLSYSAGGFLTGLPLLLMAIGAVPGAYLINRVGARQALAYGLALVGFGALLRGLLPSVVALFLFTIILAIGISLSQPALPSIVQQWFPARVGRAVAIYSNGLLVGEVIAASITLPLLLNPFGWQVALAAWAVPALIVLALWLTFTPRGTGAPVSARAWLPDWRSGRTIRIGFVMGGAGLVYFGMNSWIPDTLDARNAHNLIPITLGVLNAAQLPVSFMLTVVGDALLGKRWPFILAGIGGLAGVAGYAFAPVGLAPLFAGLAGAGSSLAFILNLGLPALLSPTEVARTSGFMFAVGYGTAVLGPVLGGVAWDWTGHYRFALLPMGIGALAVLTLGATMSGLRPLAKTRTAVSLPGL